MGRIAALAMVIAFQSTPVAGANDVSPQPTKTELGFRFDCLHNFNIAKGGTQDCLEISGLRLGFEHHATSVLKARLRIDPFSTPQSSSADTPLRKRLPKSSDTELGIIDAFGVIW